MRNIYKNEVEGEISRWASTVDIDVCTERFKKCIKGKSVERNRSRGSSVWISKSSRIEKSKTKE